MTKPILEIENLNAFFPGKQVLHDVSLTVQTGRKLALVGESGSGKTVLAQGIMRLNPLVYNKNMAELIDKLFEAILKMRFTTNTGPTIMLINRAEFESLKNEFKELLK